MAQPNASDINLLLWLAYTAGDFPISTRPAKLDEIDRLIA